ncbi:BA75_04995T0 [Komagataella pastoris]|uniref:BA75_04995T0 n=1 Tax=Komagataella pastoris TaxID=4922 RepID=A0A1B2JH62_PICPA|nr:BA75_04995T0 [Komagataella pastoris]
MSNKGLSSRVLNMKFMKNSDDNKAEEFKAAKVTDSSEWALPNASKMKKKLRRVPIESVGYSDAAGFSSRRRVFGETDEKFGEEEVEKSDEETEKDSAKTKRKKKGSKESEGFLDDLWKKTQAKRKSTRKESQEDQDASKKLRTE